MLCSIANRHLLSTQPTNACLNTTTTTGRAPSNNQAAIRARAAYSTSSSSSSIKSSSFPHVRQTTPIDLVLVPILIQIHRAIVVVVVSAVLMLALQLQLMPLQTRLVPLPHDGRARLPALGSAATLRMPEAKFAASSPHSGFSHPHGLSEAIMTRARAAAMASLVVLVASTCDTLVSSSSRTCLAGRGTLPCP